MHVIFAVISVAILFMVSEDKYSWHEESKNSKWAEHNIQTLEDWCYSPVCPCFAILEPKINCQITNKVC